MATQFLDVPESRKLTDPNPIAALVWFILVVIETSIFDFGLFVVIVAMLTGIICIIFFGYTLRTIALNIRFLVLSTQRLTPNFDDPSFISNEQLSSHIRIFCGSDEETNNKKAKEIYSSLKS